MLNWVKRREYILLAGITLIAALARFYHITELPPGLHFDEAFENVQALDILAGRGYPVFFEGNYGVEPTLIYLIALYYRVFGVSALAGRLIAAAMGTLTVPALYLLVRAVFQVRTTDGQDDTAIRASGITKHPPAYGGTKRESDHLAYERTGEKLQDRAVILGLLSTLSLALLFWHVHFSRLGIEPIFVPLNTILMLCFLWQGLETGRPLAFILAGALVGFGPYTYPAGRLLPLLAACVGLHCLLAHSKRLNESSWRSRYVRGIVLAVIAAAIVFAPLGWYFKDHPHLLTQRMSQVGVTAAGQGSASPLETITGNLERAAYMYTVQGDSDVRNNVPGRSVLDLGWSVLFFVGLAACIVRFRNPSYGLPLWWLVVLTIPTVLSEYAPHFRRALGAAPAVAVLIAIGVVTLLEWVVVKAISQERTDGATAQHYPYIVAIAVALIWLYGAGASVYAYFVTWAQTPALYYAFDVGLRDIGEYVHGLPPEEMAYLSPVRQDHQTLIFTVGQEFRPKTFDGRRCLVLPPPDSAASYIHLVAEDQGLPHELKTYLPDLSEVHRFGDYTGDLYAIVHHVPAGHRQTIEPAIHVQARLGESIELIGADVPTASYRPGDMIAVTIYWRALDSIDRDYTASVQLHGPFNPATNGPLWAQEDAQAGKGTYPTTRWTRGETVIESYSLVIPPSTPPGTYTLHASMYWLPTLERLPVTIMGEPEESGTVELGTVEVAG